MRLALAALLAALAFPATAAAQWTQTAAVGMPTFGTPAMLFGANGSALLTALNYPAAAGTTTPAMRTQLATWTPGGDPVVKRTLKDELVAGPLALGGGKVLLVRQHPIGKANRVQLSTSVGTIAGAAGRGRALARFEPAFAYAVARSRKGEVALAWIEYLPPPKSAPTFPQLRLRLAVMPRGGRFGRPRTV